MDAVNLPYAATWLAFPDGTYREICFGSPSDSHKKIRGFRQDSRNCSGARRLCRVPIAAYTWPMAKLVVFVAALAITALCAVLALYAMKMFLFVLLHWQAMVALSLLFYASIFLAASRQKRRAKREP